MRGQPPKLTPDQHDGVVALVADGLTMAAVAQQLGVTRATLYNHAARDPHLAERLAAVQQLGKERRKERRAALKDLQHGTESSYIKGRCRCGACTAAASDARHRRRIAKAVVLVLPSTPAPTVYELANDLPTRTDLADTA